MNKKTKGFIYSIIAFCLFLCNSSVVKAEFFAEVADRYLYDNNTKLIVGTNPWTPPLLTWTKFTSYRGNYLYFQKINGLRFYIIDKNGNMNGHSVDFIGDKSVLGCGSGCSNLQRTNFIPTDSATLYSTKTTGQYKVNTISSLIAKGQEVKKKAVTESYSGWNAEENKYENHTRSNTSDCVSGITWTNTSYFDTYISKSGYCYVPKYPAYYRCNRGASCLCNAYKNEVDNHGSYEVFSAGRQYCAVVSSVRATRNNYYSSQGSYYSIGTSQKVPYNSTGSINSSGSTGNVRSAISSNTTVYYWSKLSGKSFSTASSIRSFVYNQMYSSLEDQDIIYKVFEQLGITNINILDKEILDNYYIVFEPLLYARMITPPDNSVQYAYYGSVSEVYNNLKRNIKNSTPRLNTSYALNGFAGLELYLPKSIGKIRAGNDGVCSNLRFGSSVGSGAYGCGAGMYSLTEIFWDKSFACHYEVSINGSTDCTKSDTGHVFDIVNGGSLITAISNSKSWTCIQKSETVYGSDFYYDKSLSQKTGCKVYCVEDISYKFPSSIININAGRRITVSGDLTTSDDNISPISITGTKVCRASGDRCTAKLENAAKNDAYSDLNPQLTIKFNSLYNSTVKYLNTYTLVPNSSVSVSTSSNIVTVNKNLSYSIKENNTTGEYYHYVCKNGISYHNPAEKEKCKYLEYSNVPISFDTPPGTYTYTITMSNLFGKNQKFYGIISKGKIADIDDPTETLGNYITQYKKYFVPSGSYLPSEFISVITSQRATAFEDLKNTSCYQFYGCTEENGKVKCTINAKSPGNTNKTTLYENFYYCVVNIKSILNNIYRTQTGSGNFGTYTCKYKVTNYFKGKNSFIYRPISLTDPFPGESGDGRTPGTNWNSESIIYDVIKTARGTSPDTPYELYKKEPIYEFILTPTNISKIKKYNDNNEYTDFDLYCGLDSNNKSTGENCISNFVKNGISKGYFTKASGTCYGVSSSKLDTCKGG